jgi:outer membrane protein OmpA-like peptidoglycan-associated protein
MPVNLLTLLENELAAEALPRVASFIGEPLARTQSAVATVIPAALHALNQKTRTPHGAGELFDLMQQGGLDGKAFRGAGSMLAAMGAAELVKTGTPLAASVFGTRLGGLTDWLASTAGLGKQSAATLLSLVIPIILNLIAREASSAGGFNAASVANLLRGQESLLGVLPGLAPVLGLTTIAAPERAPTTPEPARAYADPEPAEAKAAVGAAGGGGSGYGWLKWVIPLLLLPLLIWAWRGTRTSEAGLDVTPAPGVVTPPATTALVKRPLTCGQVLDVAESGIEPRLIGFLDDQSRPVDDTTWFSFDRLEFETASATLKPSSEGQLQNIADILNCYTNVELKIGGYTDNAGDPASNLKLSQARAETTMKAIVARGVNPVRLTAEGYGEQHPVAPNDSETGRQRNRRIDVRVTRK